MVCGIYMYLPPLTVSVQSTQHNEFSGGRKRTFTYIVLASLTRYSDVVRSYLLRTMRSKDVRDWKGNQVLTESRELYKYNNSLCWGQRGHLLVFDYW